MVLTFLDLTKVKAHLNKSSTRTVDDDELSESMEAVEAAIIEAIGPVVSTAQDEWHDGGSTIVRVDYRQILTVTTVTESAGTYRRTLTEQPLDGSTFDAYGYTVDKGYGVITRRVSGVAAPFMLGRRNVHVAYTAGFATVAANVPKNIVMAGEELTRWLWEPQRGSGQQRGGSNSQPTIANTLPAAGDAFPIRVEQLLRRYRSPGIG